MLAAVGITVCVGVVVTVWVAGALYNALHRLHSAAHAPRERIPSQPGSTALIVVAVVCAGLAVAGRSHFDGLAIFGREVVDVCVKFSGGAGQAGPGGVVIDVTGDGG